MPNGGTSERTPHDASLSQGPLVQKISRIIKLTNTETSCLEALHSNTVSFEPGQDLLVEGHKIEHAYIQAGGWAFRYKTLADGRRQILNFVLPGDMSGIYGGIRTEADESVAAHTRVKCYAFDPVELIELFGNCPRVGVAIAWLVGRQDAIMSEQVLRVGRRTAYERTGHLILELLNRLRHTGDAESRSFELPITQELMADCLGLSVVHVNRTLRKLREHGVVHVKENRILIDDLDRLINVTGFDGGYLEPHKLPPKADAALSA